MQKLILTQKNFGTLMAKLYKEVQKHPEITLTIEQEKNDATYTPAIENKLLEIYEKTKKDGKSFSNKEDFYAYLNN